MKAGFLRWLAAKSANASSLHQRPMLVMPLAHRNTYSASLIITSVRMIPPQNPAITRIDQAPRAVLILMFGYVEKKTRGFAVPVANCPWVIGAGFAEMGCFLASAISSRSILRCSCGMGRLGCIMRTVCHSTDESHSWRISNENGAPRAGGFED